MRPQDIINKALDKAITNGMKWYGVKLIGFHYYEESADYDEHWGLVYENGEEHTVHGRYNIIFNHGFAKAFYGDKVIGTYIRPNVNDTKLENWQSQLIKCVLSGKPIAYLEKYL